MTLLSTSSKSRISKQMSYVLGAESVSAIFADTPQYDLFELHFNGPYPNQANSLKDRLVLRINFHRSGPSIHNPRGSQNGPWSIRVYAVPRTLKSMIKQNLLEEVLPNDVLPWLKKIGRLDGQEGNQMIDVYFESGTQACYTQPYHGGTEPRRAN